MVIAQISFQQGCEVQKHPQKHNVQDMIKILCNVENVQCLILGKRVAQLRCIRKRLVLYFEYLLETQKPSMMPTIISVISLLTNYFRFTSFKYKLGLVKILIDRAYNITTSEILKRNVFPKWLMDKSVKDGVFLQTKFRK